MAHKKASPTTKTESIRKTRAMQKPTMRSPMKKLVRELIDDIQDNYIDESGICLVSKKDILFIGEYLSNGFNARKAYQLAHPTCSPITARSNACNILNRPVVREVVRRFMANYLHEAKLKLDKLLIDGYMAQAFYDPADLLNIDGTPKYENFEDIPPKLRRVITGIEKKYYGKDADTSVTVFKLADRRHAMEQLAKFVQLIQPERIEHTGAGGGPIQIKTHHDMSKLTDEQLHNIIKDVP